MWNARLFWLVKIRLIYFVKKLFWPLKLLIMLGILWPIGGQSFSLATRPDVSQEAGETIEMNWRKIPEFEVVVSKFLTEP
jgi:hypothetical protein